MKHKNFFLALVFLFLPGCVAYFPPPDVLITANAPIVRVVHHNPPPSIHVNHTHRRVERRVHRHHYRGQRHYHHRQRHRHHHHRRSRR